MLSMFHREAYPVILVYCAKQFSLGITLSTVPRTAQVQFFSVMWVKIVYEITCIMSITTKLKMKKT
jgi:hypothetical protein